MGTCPTPYMYDTPFFHRLPWDTEILDNTQHLHASDSGHSTHARILRWVTLPGYAYYFTFVWVELHRPCCFSQAANL